MKNKKAEQVRKKREHKKRLKEARLRRRKEPSLRRKEPDKLEKASILIVCEGKNTEPSYFNKFRLTSATIKALGEGYNTVSLVNRAIELSKRDNYDQVWCVFDKDAFPANDFNNAIVIAESQGFKVAYSNQAFEYWLILHFEDHQGGALERSRYYDKLNSYLKLYGVEFDPKNKIVTEEVFDILVGNDEKSEKVRQDLAIDRAKRNYNNFDHRSPAIEESSTLVFLLIEEIKKFL